MSPKHRIEAAREDVVAGQDRRPSLLTTFRAQACELVVQIEDQRRALKSPCSTARVRVQPNNEKPLAAEAEREVRLVRISADTHIGLLAVLHVLVR